MYGVKDIKTISSDVHLHGILEKLEVTVTVKEDKMPD